MAFAPQYVILIQQLVIMMMRENQEPYCSTMSIDEKQKGKSQKLFYHRCKDVMTCFRSDCEITVMKSHDTNALQALMFVSSLNALFFVYSK
jgi:hypothetical protein